MDQDAEVPVYDDFWSLTYKAGYLSFCNNVDHRNRDAKDEHGRQLIVDRENMEQMWADEIKKYHRQWAKQMEGKMSEKKIKQHLQEALLQIYGVYNAKGANSIEKYWAKKAIRTGNRDLTTTGGFGDMNEFISENINDKSYPDYGWKLDEADQKVYDSLTTPDERRQFWEYGYPLPKKQDNEDMDEDDEGDDDVEGSSGSDSESDSDDNHEAPTVTRNDQESTEQDLRDQLALFKLSPAEVEEQVAQWKAEKEAAEHAKMANEMHKISVGGSGYPTQDYDSDEEGGSNAEEGEDMMDICED